MAGQEPGSPKPSALGLDPRGSRSPQGEAERRGKVTDSRKVSAVSAADVTGWQAHMGFTDAEAMRRIGIGNRGTWAGYKQHGAPLTVGLAMSAVAHGLGPWAENQPVRARLSRLATELARGIDELGD